MCVCVCLQSNDVCFCVRAVLGFVVITYVVSSDSWGRGDQASVFSPAGRVNEVSVERQGLLLIC